MTDFTSQVTARGTEFIVHSGSLVLTNDFGTWTLTTGQSGLLPLTGPPAPILDREDPMLRPGKYQYAVTYLRNDGQESGTGLAGNIELLDKGAISLTSIPVSTDATVTRKIIYCTPPNGEILYRVGIIANSVTSFLIDTTRQGASPLATQFLSPPPAGDHIAYWKGWMLVASGNRLYVSEPYAPELFDLRKSYPFLDRITMIAALNNDTDGVWIGTESQVIWLDGDSPETWKMKPAADYGVIPGTLSLFDGDVLLDGKDGGNTLAFFATTRGTCLAKSDGALANVTESRFAYPIQERGAGVVRRHRGSVQYVVTMQGAETAGNIFV